MELQSAMLGFVDLVRSCGTDLAPRNVHVRELLEIAQ